MARDAQVEVTQLKSLEPQLSEDSPLENFIRLTEDRGLGWARVHVGCVQDTASRSCIYSIVCNIVCIYHYVYYIYIYVIIVCNHHESLG